MSRLSKAFKKITQVAVAPIAAVTKPLLEVAKPVFEVAKEIAKPVIAVVDPVTSIAGVYGKDVQKDAAINVGVGAVGAAVIASAPATAAATVSTLAADIAKDVGKEAVTAAIVQHRNPDIAFEPPRQEVFGPGPVAVGQAAGGRQLGLFELIGKFLYELFAGRA